MRLFTKDPDDTLDYIIDWTDWLADGDTISASAVTVDAGLTKDSDSNTTATVTVWLSGGTQGSVYRVENQITTTQMRTKTKSFMVRVTDG